MVTTMMAGEGEKALPANIPTEENSAADFSQDFFAKPVSILFGQLPGWCSRQRTGLTFAACQAYLTVSGQLNAEIYASALKDVYTFGPTFRAVNSNTSRHLAEFWMIEPEMSFADLQDDIVRGKRCSRL